MVYSFDIFDTCLIRTCGLPVLAFDLLAERVLGKNCPEPQLMDFSNIRRNGEKKARERYQNGEKEEVSLKEIYSMCDFSAITPVPNEEILNLELDIESEILVPVKAVKDEIDILRSQGNKIIFISDMYLPQSFILDVLRKTGLYQKGDNLYVSSEYGKTKGRGNLFKFVMEVEHIDKRRWLHRGDNPWSDVKVPQSLGIKTKKLSHPWTHSEHLCGGLDLTSGKFIHKMCASFSRAIRLTNPQTPEYEFAAEFVAPLLVSFVIWLLNDTQAKGFKRIYFLARDAEIFYKIAQRLGNRFPEIDIHYLYVSRKTLYLPGMEGMDAEAITASVKGPKKLLNILDSLQMDDEIEIFKKYDCYEGLELVEALLADDIFVEKLHKKQMEQQELCLKYFKEEDMDEGCSAIVDLSGSRRCHLAINRILKLGNLPEVYAYFFTTFVDRIPGKNYTSFNFGERFEIGRTTYKLPSILILEEYFCMSDHESAASYNLIDDHVIPVLGCGVISSDRRKKIFRIHEEVCIRYADMFSKYIDLAKASDLCKSMFGVLSDFFDAPEKKYLKAFDGITFSYTSVEHAELLQKTSFFRLLRRKNDGLWFSGNLVYNSPLPGLTTFMLRIVRLIRIFKHNSKI